MTSEAEVWVVIDDRIGIQVQALGLAEALGRPFVVKSFNPNPPWTWLPISWPRPKHLMEEAGLNPPWPDLVIGCGRRMVPFLRVMRGPSTKVVFLGDPTVNPKIFDLVIAPNHDRMSDPNVVSTLGSMHRITPERLAAAHAEFAPLFGPLPKPKIGVLIGGASNHHDLPVATARDFADKLAMLADSGAGLMITPSRRTPEAALLELRRRLNRSEVRIWDRVGANPYFGMLAHADALIVTNDSVNMATEACTTGKPVMVYPLPGRSRRIARFHRELARRGLTRPFQGRLEMFETAPLREMDEVVARIREILAEPPKTSYL